MVVFGRLHRLAIALLLQFFVQFFGQFVLLLPVLGVCLHGVLGVHVSILAHGRLYVLLLVFECLVPPLDIGEYHHIVALPLLPELVHIAL